MIDRWRTIALSIILWFLFGLFDFWSEFVSFSLARLILLGVLSLALLPFDLAIFERLFSVLRKRRISGHLFLMALVAIGYMIFFTRYLRGASMADDFIFSKVIQNTANGCFFCYSAPGGIYFGNHNNLFLVSFVPLTLFPNWWLLVHLVQSVVLVAWCRVCGWAVGGESSLGWVLTIALFLATYTQHASFYDTRFSALALSVFALGFYLFKTRLMWASALTALITRETTGLVLMMFGLVGVFRKSAQRSLLVIGVAGLVWFIASYLLMTIAGRAPALMRFNPCFNPTQSLPDFPCILTSLTTDWELKLAYTLRLVRFAPSLTILPSLIAASPDLALTWLSEDHVLYNLSWHYYMQTLGILIVAAGVGARARFSPRYSENLSVRWIVATCLWQFATLVRPALF